MRRPIELSDVGMPAPEYPEECPSIPAAEFEARIAAVLAAVDADWVVVYGDREHHASFVWLCNLDPRFEEALLVLGRDRRTLLLGKENVGYTPIIPAGLDFDVVCVPTLSLMGIDRSGFPTVEQALRDAGISAGDRVGVIGWKALLPEEWNGGYEAIFAPAFFVDTLRAITGDPALVRDATAVVTNPRDGLRTFCSADQIAVFEWGAARCSAWVSLILRSVRPGMTEREAFHVVPWGGEPLSMHPVFSSGPEVAVGQPAIVRSLQRPRNFGRCTGGTARWHRPIALEQRRQVGAVDVFGDQIRTFVVRSEVVDGGDIRVVKARGSPGLPAEVGHEVGVRGVFGAQELDRDVAVELEVGRPVHGGEAPLAEQLHQPVAAPDNASYLGHQGPLMAGAGTPADTSCPVLPRPWATCVSSDRASAGIGGTGLRCPVSGAPALQTL